MSTAAQHSHIPAIIIKALRLMLDDGWSGTITPMANALAAQICPQKTQCPTPKSIIVAPEHLQFLLSQGLATCSGTQLHLRPEAALFLRRVSIAALPIDPFSLQHLHLTPALQENPQDELLMPNTPRNVAESPLQWLAKRTEKNGTPWLCDYHVQAGEKLRADFTFGQLMPSTSVNWSAAAMMGVNAQSNRNGAENISNATLAARQRYNAAMAAVGTELSGVLVDVCCFLKGVSHVEKERQWPARSAKVVLKMALETLARHYGLAPIAYGRPSRKTRNAWGAQDYRPTLQ